MDTRPIGVFDSGMGGLTCVRQMIRLLPGEDIVYFGDTGRVPYGGRSVETIVRYARQDVAFLRSFDLKAIVIACGTVSTTAMDVLKRENDLPILGVVQPAAKAAVEATKTGNIGVIGTKATIRSGAYEAAIRNRRADAALFVRACPLLVPLVEEGRVSPEDPIVREIVHAYFTPFVEEKVDTIVLGCTHYPLLKAAIGAFLSPAVTLIDTGEACVRSLVSLLAKREALCSGEQNGIQRYYVSDRAEDFASLASLFLGEDVSSSVNEIEIERY